MQPSFSSSANRRSARRKNQASCWRDASSAWAPRRLSQEGHEGCVLGASGFLGSELREILVSSLLAPLGTLLAWGILALPGESLAGGFREYVSGDQWHGGVMGKGDWVRQIQVQVR